MTNEKLVNYGTTLTLIGGLPLMVFLLWPIAPNLVGKNIGGIVFAVWIVVVFGAFLCFWGINVWNEKTEIGNFLLSLVTALLMAALMWPEIKPFYLAALN